MFWFTRRPMVSSLSGSSPVHPWPGVRGSYRRSPSALEWFSRQVSGQLARPAEGTRHPVGRARKSIEINGLRSGFTVWAVDPDMAVDRCENWSVQDVVEAVAVEIGLDVGPPGGAGALGHGLDVGVAPPG